MFSNALKYHRKNAKMSQKELAEQLNVSQSTIAMWESGKNTPAYNSLIELTAIFNVSLDSLVGNSSDMIIKSIPVFNDGCTLSQLKELQNVLCYENILIPALDYNNYFGLIIQSESMAPRIMRGDLVIAKECQDFRSGDIYITCINRTNITVKKVIKNDYGIILISLNNIFEPTFYSTEDINKLQFSIIGKVIELRAKIN